jgi:hypothetical protein
MVKLASQSRPSEEFQMRGRYIRQSVYRVAIPSQHPHIIDHPRFWFEEPFEWQNPQSHGRVASPQTPTQVVQGVIHERRYGDLSGLERRKPANTNAFDFGKGSIVPLGEILENRVIVPPLDDYPTYVKHEDWKPT